MSMTGLLQANCKNCYKCIKVCPVKSIKFSEEQANIIERDCIFCGRCFLACPQNAKTVSSDLGKVQEWIRQGEKVLVSLAPSYYTALEFEDENQVPGAFRRLGVAGVGMTADGAAYVTAEYHKLLKEGKMKNLITTCCPAVNDLAEKYYPQVLPYMAPVVTPMVAHARLLKQAYPQAKVVFVGPCIAKKEEAQDIRHNNEVDAVLTFEDLKQWFRMEDVTVEESPRGEFLRADSEILRMYPIHGGIIATLQEYAGTEGYDLVSVDGIDEVKALFESLSQGEVEHCFVEVNSCVGGCINGPAKGGQAKNRFRGKLSLEKHVETTGCHYPVLQDKVKMGKKFVDRTASHETPDEATIRSILAKIGKETPDQELNCGSCGYATCRDKAIAVYQGKAELGMCLPYMKERAESLSNYVLTETPNITLMVDEELNIIEFNAAAEKAFGITRYEALQKGLYELIDTADFQFVLESKESIYDKKVHYDEYQMTTLQSIIYVAKNNIVMGIFKDITKEEHDQEAMYQLRVDTVEMAQKVIQKQMVAAQEIASLLGETTAETKVTLTKLKNMIVFDGDES